MAENQKAKRAESLDDLDRRTDELSDAEAETVAGGGFPSISKKPPMGGKPVTYIPAPPAPQVPIPYPSGM